MGTLRIIQQPGPFGGIVYTPTDDNSHAGMLLLHGSEGGWSGWMDRLAVLFAAHGLCAYAFRCMERG